MEYNNFIKTDKIPGYDELIASMENVAEKLRILYDNLNSKTDKVQQATSGNFAGLDSDGNLVDSGYNAADFSTHPFKYKGTIGINGDIQTLPDVHEVGWLYIVSDAGTYVGVTCVPGDYIVCKNSGIVASDADWNAIHPVSKVIVFHNIFFY